jgi:MYXO-CTERM domain-containing protein
MVALIQGAPTIMASLRPLFPVFFLLAGLAAAREASADEPLTLRQSWSGKYGFFSTGAALAKDSDMDGKVDMLTQPATVKITADDLPAKPSLHKGYLYWGGTQLPTKCANKANLDDTVTFTPPGGVPTPVKADVCYCSSSLTYEMQLCRGEVTDIVDKMVGDYVVTDFTAAVANTDTDNASFALVLVHKGDGLKERRIALYDGLFALALGGTPSATVTLDGLEVSNVPAGDLTWYALEGDVTLGEGEFVEAMGLPGKAKSMLFDDLNPANNPFNRTINTMMPAKKGVTGVDIDRFSLAPVLKPNDTSLQITYGAGMDKYWIAFNVVGVDVTDVTGGEFAASSSKNWALTGDVNGDGLASPGDTVTYTIHVENTGDTAGVVTVVDQIPAAAASWQLMEAGGGTDKSLGNTMIVEGLVLQAAQSIDVVLTLVLADVPDLEVVVNEAQLDSGQPEGVALVAPPLEVRRDGDADTVFDTDDNCPEVANTDQADGDGNGLGDACEAATATTGAGETGEPSTSTTGTTGATPTTGEVVGTTGAMADTTGDNGSTGDSAGGTGGESTGDGCSCHSTETPVWPMGGPSLLLLLLGAAGVHRRRVRM